ncbi:hypothetical protein GCM10010166_30000 [Couchioplanes caeruleus subsp. azureus]|nr:hypothetical protein GCM10010166_30000 [Couchioplanes caeruleus subsp. azureus]
MVNFPHPAWPPIEHLGRPPGWDCAACAQPWPCTQAKSELLVEFAGRPTLLTLYLSSYMSAAAKDLTAHDGRPPADLWQRFLGWIPQTGPGTPPGPIPSTPPEETPAPTEETPNTPPRETPSAPPEQAPGTPPGETPGTPPEETPGTPPGGTPGTPPGSAPESDATGDQ